MSSSVVLTRTMYIYRYSSQLCIIFTVLLLLLSGGHCSNEVECGDWSGSNIRNCSVWIQEEVPTNTLVFNPLTYFVSDQIIVYASNSDNYGTHFTDTNKMLYTRGDFDREEMVDRSTAPFPVTFLVTIVSYTVNHQQTILLTVHVMDYNDNVPRFKKGQSFLGNSLQLQRFESPNIDTILTVEAVDYDEGLNGTSSVELVQPDPPMFNLSIVYDGDHPTTIYVVPINPLDREIRDTYTFQLIAYEGISQPSNATLNVTLTVQDINDNLPQFNETEYITTVSESSPVDTNLIHVHANDPDIGTNAAITYTIQDVCAKRTVDGSCLDINEPWPFVLDTESGVLQIREMLNYEEVVQYRLTIDASNPNEQQGGSSTALVNILVADVNDKPPEVTNFVATPSLSESSLVNSTYGSFKVRDNDSDAFSIFRLFLLDNSTMLNSTTFGLQSSVQSSFNIILLRTLDRETQDIYNLIIRAEDALNSSLFTTYHFSVVVSDFNDHPPIFNTIANPVLFDEESPVDTQVIHLTATDQDTGSNAAIQYSLPDTSLMWPFQGNFTIQAFTGKVLVAVLLDRETTPTMSLLVQARDLNGTGLTTFLIVNITLRDINDNAPVITSTIPGTINVTENAGMNTLIIDVDAMDADVGSNAVITYSVTLLSPELSTPLPFVMNPSTGRLMVNGTLDHETVPQYSLRISVTDGVNSPTQNNFVLNVQDVNDNSPVFDNSNYYRTVHENVSLNSPVITMVAEDADSAQVTNLTYSVVGGASSHFTLNPLTGVVTTSASLDWEVKSEYTLVIRANDGFGRVSSTDANLIITVIDINDEIPRFVGAPYMFSVDEGTGANAYVGQVSVESRELGQNGAPLFFIDTNSVPFSINATGAIFTTSNLNREERSSYAVTVRVEDVAPPPHYNTTVVMVTVADINDNPPVFTTTLVHVSVSEIQAVNSPFYTASAIDNDIYPNNVTKYYLNPASPGFQINVDTGELSLTTSLNYEVQQNVLLTIRAQDNGNPDIYFATQQVNLTVLDDNNTNITFPSNFPLEYHLAEDTPLDYVLLNFTGEDHKGNPRLHLTYYLTDQLGAVPSAFGLERESSTGYALLTVTAALDRETTATYVLNITITDTNTSPPSTVTQFLTIILTDINDNPPVFLDSSYTMFIQEERSGRQEIGTITASDPDNGTNGTVVYSLQNTMSGLFYINNVTGELYQERSLDRETRSSYTLTVVASDQGNPLRQTQTPVVVMVTDINDNRPTFTPNRVQVEENLNVGTIVTTLVGHDDDIGQNGKVTFTYTQASTATSHFQLLPNGTIRVTQVPDYETNTEFIFFVIVQDNGDPPLQSTGNITIHVTDLNDNCPIFNPPLSQYNISVLENTTTGTLLLNVTATDLDQGAAGVVKYTMENIVYTHQFDIDSYTGEITLVAPLDYETTPHYEIGILAYDQGLPRNRICRQTVHISVINVNESPPRFDVPLYVFAVNEGSLSGTIFGEVQAYDSDSNSILTYSLVNSQVFEIVSNTGELKTLADLDYESVPLYNVTVKVTDEGGKTGTTAVLILVNNINDHDPVFPHNTFTASISEVAHIGTPVITVTATDGDNHTNTPVTYDIVGGNMGNVFGVHRLVGEVYVNGVLDYETTSDYALTIRATDTGSPNRTVTTNVVITVINHNEYSPQFSSHNYTFNLTENLPPGTILGRVNATDLDGGNYGNVKYYLSSSLFTIGASTGVIETLIVIDRESTPSLPPLTVIASDGYRNTSANVSIIITDLNDSPPYFPSNLYEFNVDLSTSVGSIIGTVVAIDPDLSPLTNYMITNDNIPFAVNVTTGELNVSSPLTAVNVPYQFTVTATDSGNTTLTDVTTVRIYIVTSNDHYPNFTQSVYTVTVQENYVPSQPLVRTLANDPDTGSNSVIRYSLTPNGGLTLNQFSINQLSGDLSLSSPLDYEAMTSHDVIVYARDSTPSHPRTATTHVLVTVTNVNDNQPMFTNFTSSISLSYVPYIGLELFRLSATDADRSPFSFQLWTQTNKFSIDSETGIVRNIIVLNTSVTYSLEVRVYDSNYTTSQTMSITIVPPSSQLTPSFSSESSSLTVSETAAIDKQITTFTALNSPSSYHIVCCGTSLPFRLNSQSGSLTVSDSLNFEEVEMYQLVIEARKLASNGTRFSDYQQVTISVTNINEYTPTFVQTTTTITISESTSNGSLITQLTAQDDDTGSYGTISYHIINGNVNNTFNIGESNGAITVANGKTLDRELVPQYILLIKATDGGGKESVAMVTIILQDENDSPPQFSGNYTIDIYEPGHDNDRVIKVNAIDPDIDSILTYQLGSVRAYLSDTDKGLSNKFTINSTTGVISLNGVVDFETADRYEFSVTVTDSQFTDTTHVTVNVLDINDNEPIFQSFNNNNPLNLYELSPAGTSVVQVRASDIDSLRHSMIRYSLGNNWPTNKFTIDPLGGMIYVQEPMNVSELASDCDGHFTATVYASDGVSNTSTSVTINVRDVNNFAPVFVDSPYNIIVSETTPIGESLIPGGLFITDADCGLNMFYTTTFPNYYFQPKSLFSLSIVSSGEYELVTRATLPQGVYHFRIEAHNSRPFPTQVKYYRASYSHVTVTVLPNNTHAPVFTTPTTPLSVYENSAQETQIGYIIATDNDLGVSGLVNYRLNTSLSSPFVINGSTGLLTVNGSLDYETKSSYNIQVIASDNGYPIRSVDTFLEVLVLDRDDNPPVFARSMYYGTVKENSPLNRTVLTLNVTDADSVVSVRYSIKNSTSGLPFKLHPLTGILSISGSIDYETQTEYLLEVSGTGLTNSEMASMAWVLITVESVNEYAPVLPNFNEPITVPLGLPKGGVVTTVVATDADKGKDGEITYQFEQVTRYLKTHSNGTIILNVSQTDIISSTSKKRQENNNTDIVIQLRVVAMDTGTPPKNDTKDMTIIIPEGRIVATPITPSKSPLTLEVIVIMSTVVGTLIIIIILVFFILMTVFIRSHKLKKKKLDLTVSGQSSLRMSPQITEIPHEEDDSGGRGVELRQMRHIHSVTPTKTVSNNHLNKHEQDDNDRTRRHSPHTRSTSDLASSIATDTLNLTQETSFPYAKGQIEAIYAANVDLLHDGSQASVHTFGSEGGGESDGDEFENLYYTKYSEIDVEGSLIVADDDMSSLGKPDHSISESSDGIREDEYHFSQSTNPWSSRRSINDLLAEHSSALLYSFNHSQGGPPHHYGGPSAHSQGVVPPHYGGPSTQGSNTSLLRGQRHSSHYRGGSERDIPRHYSSSQPHHHHHHRVPHPPSNYEYYHHEPETPPIPSSLVNPPPTRSSASPRRYESTLMDYRNPMPRGYPPPPYYTQDPVPHNLTQGSSSRGGENYYSRGFPNDPLQYDRQTLSTSSTSLSTSASHPYRGRGYP